MNVPVSTRDMHLLEDSPAKGQAALEAHEWRQLDAYWRAANYLSVGQIYLYANPLLRQTLTLADVKPLVVGHWGTTPGQNFIYVHLNRTIRLHDLDMIYIAGPGHGGPALVANTYLEGSYSEIYPDISQDEAGMNGSLSNFLSREAFQAMSRRRRPVRFTKAANSDIR
jgi:xylulose-5-phosphate/fructose-6-phosphate phosphoketolase